MKCEERFYDYIDYVKGKLPSDISLEIDKHISSCNQCKKEVENIKSFILTLDNFNVKEPNEIYFTNLITIINEKIENKKRNKIENIQYNKLVSVMSLIIFAVILALTYNVSNVQISTQTFVNDKMELSVDNYNLFGYTIYEDVDNDVDIDVEKKVTEAIADILYHGLLFQDTEYWFSSQENIKSYAANFSDNELENIINKLKNKQIIN
jgi:hypothetical protein